MICTLHLRRTVEDHHLGFRTGGVLSEAYNLGWLRSGHPCKTGCWRYDHTTKKHEIMLSQAAYRTITKGGPAEGKRVQVPDFYRSLYEHEAAHSLYTTKDLEGLAKKLGEHKIPWRLHNLFEDVRIERQWIRYQRRGKLFRWTRWIKHPEPMKTSATALLYALKTEGIRRTIPRTLWATYGGLPFWSKVLDYYRRIIRCHASEDLIPVLLDWLKDFPATGDDTIEGEGGDGTGDLAASIAEATGKAPSSVKAKDPKGNGAAPSDREGSPSDPSTEPSGHPTHAYGGASGGGAVVTASDEHGLSMQLASMLDGAFRGGEDYIAPRSAVAKRLNVRGLLRGAWNRPFIGAVEGRGGKPHISYFVDCSGSMKEVRAKVDRDGRRGTVRCDTAGRILGRALSILARRGRITATAYGVSHGGCHYKMDLPCREDHWRIGRFLGWSGAEGISLALTPGGKRSVFDEVAKRSKLAVVYTDGEITDEPFVRDSLRARGVYTLGLCCSERDYSGKLRANFDYSLSRDSLFGMADALVRTLRAIPSQ